MKKNIQIPVDKKTYRKWRKSKELMDATSWRDWIERLVNISRWENIKEVYK